MAEILSGEVVRLEIGLVARLAGIDAPVGREQGSDNAEALLRRTVEGRETALLYGGARRDRFDRAVAHVRTIGDRHWAQGALLDAGLARVRTTPEDRALAAEMLGREARARTERRGLWTSEDWRVLLPGEIHPGFVLVEGRVSSVERTRWGWQLAFAGSDFEAEVSRAATADFAAANRHPDSLLGRSLRLRGVVRRAGGRFELQLDHPEQIELLRSPR